MTLDLGSPLLGVVSHTIRHSGVSGLASHISITVSTYLWRGPIVRATTWAVVEGWMRRQLQPTSRHALGHRLDLRLALGLIPPGGVIGGCFHRSSISDRTLDRIFYLIFLTLEMPNSLRGALMDQSIAMAQIALHEARSR